MRRLSAGFIAAAVIISVVDHQTVSAADDNKAATSTANEMNRDWLKGLPAVTAPPESLFEKYREGDDRDVARNFYKKYIDVKGLAVVASGDVSDEALQRTYYIVTHLLAGRPDVLDAMGKHGTRLIIIGKDQVYTDMPEYRHSRNPEFQNERVRGTGGLGRHQFWRRKLTEPAARSLRRREHRCTRILPHRRRCDWHPRSHLAQTGYGKLTKTP